MRQRKRPVAEDCKQLKVQQMPAAGQRAWLRWGDERGEPVAIATLEREAEAIAIGYRWREGDEWHETRQTTRLVASEPPLGGVRHFIACPQCGRRALKLFDVKGGVFGCRRCEGLPNRSQSQGAWVRALQRVRKIRQRLGAEGGAGDPMPPRPKWMRQQTYRALVAEVRALEAIPLGAWISDGRGVALGIRRSRMGAKGRCRLAESPSRMSRRDPPAPWALPADAGGRRALYDRALRAGEGALALLPVDAGRRLLVAAQ